jgi:hypothetical protein
VMYFPEFPNTRLDSSDLMNDEIKYILHGARSREQGAGATVMAKSRNEARPSRPSGRQKWKASRARNLAWWGWAMYVGLVVHKTIGWGFLSFCLKIEPEGPVQQRRDPGVTRSFKVGDMRRDLGACFEGNQCPMDVCPPNGDIYNFQNCPRGVCIFYLSCRGSLVFHLHQVTWYK